MLLILLSGRLRSRRVADVSAEVPVMESARIEAGGDIVEAGSGTLLTFEPDERHKVSSASGTRIVMILSSWPADATTRAGPATFFLAPRVPRPRATSLTAKPPSSAAPRPWLIRLELAVRARAPYVRTSWGKTDWAVVSSLERSCASGTPARTASSCAATAMP